MNVKNGAAPRTTDYRVYDPSNSKTKFSMSVGAACNQESCGRRTGCGCSRVARPQWELDQQHCPPVAPTPSRHDPQHPGNQLAHESGSFTNEQVDAEIDGAMDIIFRMPQTIFDFRNFASRTAKS